MIMVIESRRVNWVWQVASMVGIKISYRILVINLERKRNFGIDGRLMLIKEK